MILLEICLDAPESIIYGFLLSTGCEMQALDKQWMVDDCARLLDCPIWAFFAFWKPLGQLPIFVLQKLSCPLTIFNKLDSWYICSNLRENVKDMIWRNKTYWRLIVTLKMQKVMFGKYLLALSLFTLSASATNWLTCSLSLSRDHVLMTFVTTGLSHMIHMLELEWEC